MSASTDALERQLINDLQTLAGVVQSDSSFEEDLYRALANNQWHRQGQGGHVSLSWKRAEELVNDSRALQDREPLTLAQTGGEGEISERVASALGDLGWSPRPLEVGVHDDSHVDSHSDGPQTGNTESPDWERQAHAEAEENRR